MFCKHTIGESRLLLPIELRGRTLNVRGLCRRDAQRSVRG